MKFNNLIIHPLLFGIFPVLSLFESNMSFTSFSEIILPSFIILSVVIVIWLFLIKTIKNGTKSALIISYSLILFFVYGPVFFAIDDLTINGEDVGRHSYLMIPFIGFGILGILFLIKIKKELKNLTTIANFISLTIVSVILFSIGTYSLENSNSIEFESAEFEKMSNQNNLLPDIYYILLDGYPGKTSLLNVVNYDNQNFLNRLNQLGFFVQEHSYVNYPHTFLSIPSMLNMMYFDDDISLEHADTPSQNMPYLIGSNNKVMNFAKSQGYLTVSFDSGWGFSRDMKSADLKLCGDNKLFNSEFIISLVKNSMLNPVYVKIFETDKIEGKLCIFDELPLIKNRTEQPIFVFAHIFSPHPPYLFGPTGEIRQLENLDPHLETESNLDKDAFVGQLQFVNKKILYIVESLLDSESQPIIIIQSDHGTAFLFEGQIENWDSPTDEMIQERMDNITFIFLPGNETDIFSNNLTPVNTFRILFNHYFETDFEILPDKMYFGADGSYELKDVTKILMNP